MVISRLQAFQIHRADIEDIRTHSCIVQMFISCHYWKSIIMELMPWEKRLPLPAWMQWSVCEMSLGETTNSSWHPLPKYTIYHTRAIPPRSRRHLAVHPRSVHSPLLLKAETLPPAAAPPSSLISFQFQQAKKNEASHPDSERLSATKVLISESLARPAIGSHVILHLHFKRCFIYLRISCLRAMFISFLSSLPSLQLFPLA